VTSHSNKQQAQQIAVDALESSAKQLPQQTQDDIAHARQTALKVLRAQQTSTTEHSLMQQVGNWVTQPFSKVAFPVAAVVLVAVSLSYSTSEQLPQLPLAMASEEVPTEDFTMLEDLEFVTWLAENPKEALL